MDACCCICHDLSTAVNLTVAVLEFLGFLLCFVILALCERKSYALLFVFPFLSVNIFLGTFFLIRYFL